MNDSTKSRPCPLVRVTWRDAGTHTNTSLSDAVPYVAVNIGYLIQQEPFIVLQTGWYEDDEQGDYTVVPAGWASKIEVLLEA